MEKKIKTVAKSKAKLGLMVDCGMKAKTSMVEVQT